MNTHTATVSTIALASSLALGIFSVVATAQTGPMHRDNVSMNMSNSQQPPSDTWITSKVKSEMATMHGTKNASVTVLTTDGVVTLSGMLPTKAAVTEAVAAAEHVKGVKHVDAANLNVGHG